MTVLAVFRSRSQTIDFALRLSRFGVGVQTVNTPAALKIGCGLSAKFEGHALPRAKVLVRQMGYSTFVGFYGMGDSYPKNLVAV